MTWKDTGRDVLHSARAIKTVLRLPPWVPPGHFHSPLTNLADVARAKRNATRDELIGIDLRADEQHELVERMLPLWKSYLADDTPRRFNPDNSLYSRPEAVAYDAILRLYQPKTIVEVGCGHSTTVALDARDTVLPDLNLICIEPYPDHRLLGLLRPTDQLTLRSEPVQDTPLDVFDALDANDILFIDSTHVSKPGSDVNWLLFEVLPRLRPGVLIHIHDTFWPFEYPTPWLDERRDWTELYLLRAFLTHNPRFAIRLFLDYIWKTHPTVPSLFPDDHTPSGLWLEHLAA